MSSSPFKTIEKLTTCPPNTSKFGNAGCMGNATVTPGTACPTGTIRTGLYCKYPDVGLSSSLFNQIKCNGTTISTNLLCTPPTSVTLSSTTVSCAACNCDGTC